MKSDQYAYPPAAPWGTSSRRPGRGARGMETPDLSKAIAAMQELSDALWKAVCPKCGWLHGDDEPCLPAEPGEE